MRRPRLPMTRRIARRFEPPTVYRRDCDTRASGPTVKTAANATHSPKRSLPRGRPAIRESRDCPPPPTSTSRARSEPRPSTLGKRPPSRRPEETTGASCSLLSLPRRIEARCSTLLKPATVAADLGAESTDAFLRDDRNHHQPGSRIHPPPTEQRIQQQATQENRGKVATEVGLF